MPAVRGVVADMDEMNQGNALEAQAGKAPDPRQVELFNVVTGRTMEALAQDPDGLDVALKADPVAGAVEYGVKALWTVADAADKAGKPIPFEVMVASGMQVIKVLGGIANEKGYLADEDLEGFLVQAFQKAIGKYAQLDAQAGKMKPQDLQMMSKLMGGQHAEPDPDQQGGPSDADMDNRKGALAAAAGGL